MLTIYDRAVFHTCNQTFVFRRDTAVPSAGRGLRAKTVFMVFFTYFRKLHVWYACLTLQSTNISLSSFDPSLIILLGITRAVSRNLRKDCDVIVDWIHVAYDSLQWRPLVNMVMNLMVPLQTGNLSDRLSDYRVLKDWVSGYCDTNQNKLYLTAFYLLASSHNRQRAKFTTWLQARKTWTNELPSPSLWIR
jgi:hypothetical protein